MDRKQNFNNKRTECLKNKIIELGKYIKNKIKIFIWVGNEFKKSYDIQITF